MKRAFQQTRTVTRILELAGLLTWVWLIPCAKAQTPASNSPLIDSLTADLERNLQGLPNARVWTAWGPLQVRTPHVSHEGIAYDSLLSGLRLLPDSVTTRRAFPFAWIDAVQIPRKDPVSWMLRLGPLLAGAGIAYSLFDKGAESPTCNPNLFPRCYQGIGTGTAALIGLGSGLVIGSVVGLTTAHWETIYRKP